MTPVARNILSQTLANRETDDHRFHAPYVRIVVTPKIQTWGRYRINDETLFS